MTTLLPPEFADLEPFAATWCLPTEQQRWDQRMHSTMEELLAFYDATFPRIQDALKLCDGYALDELPEDVTRLLQLVYSAIMAAMAVEIWSQPRVIHSGDAALRRVAAPRP